MRVCRFFLVLFFICQSGLASPQKLSFKEALELARKNPIHVIVAREKVAQSLARLRQAEAVLLPQVSGSVSEMRQTRNLEAQGISLPGQNRLVGPFNTFDARIKAMQSLLDLGAMAQFNSYAKAKSLAEAQAIQAEEESVTLVAALYLEAFAADEKVKAEKSVLSRDEKGARIAKTNGELGLGSDLEISESEAALFAARDELEKAKTEALERKKDLLQALTLPLGENPELVVGALPKESVLPSDEEIKKAVSLHPDVAVAEKRLAQSKANKTVQVASFFPVVSGRADYGASGTALSNSLGTYAYGAELNWPLIEGGYRFQKVKESKSQVRENEALLKDAETKTEVRAMKARQEVTEIRAVLKASEGGFHFAEKNYRVVHAKVQSGIGSALDLAQARADLDQAGYVRAYANGSYVLARLNLAYALGNLEDFVTHL